jgi:hypothetical protein
MPTEAKPKSPGGYHTIFRGVKQVTFYLDGKMVNFSTRPRIKMRRLLLRLCASWLERLAGPKVPFKAPTRSEGTHDPTFTIMRG